MCNILVFHPFISNVLSVFVVSVSVYFYVGPRLWFPDLINSEHYVRFAMILLLCSSFFLL